MSPLKSALVAVAILSFPLAASAQTASSEPGQAQGPGWGRQQLADPAKFHKEMCSDRYAHNAGRLATLEARLNLTEAQRSAWDTWRQAEMDGAAKARDVCLAEMPAAGAGMSMPERQARMAKVLSVKLQQMQASQPALQALYQTLNTEQKAVLDQPRHGGWGHGHHGGHGGWQRD